MQHTIHGATWRKDSRVDASVTACALLFGSYTPFIDVLNSSKAAVYHPEFEFIMLDKHGNPLSGKQLSIAARYFAGAVSSIPFYNPDVATLSGFLYQVLDKNPDTLVNEFPMHRIDATLNTPSCMVAGRHPEERKHNVIVDQCFGEYYEGSLPASQLHATILHRQREVDKLAYEEHLAAVAALELAELERIAIARSEAAVIEAKRFESDALAEKNKRRLQGFVDEALVNISRGSSFKPRPRVSDAVLRLKLSQSAVTTGGRPWKRTSNGAPIEMKTRSFKLGRYTKNKSQIEGTYLSTYNSCACFPTFFFKEVLPRIFTIWFQALLLLWLLAPQVQVFFFFPFFFIFLFFLKHIFFCLTLQMIKANLIMN